MISPCVEAGSVMRGQASCQGLLQSLPQEWNIRFPISTPDFGRKTQKIRLKRDAWTGRPAISGGTREPQTKNPGA